MRHTCSLTCFLQHLKLSGYMAGTSNSICQTWAPAHAYPFASVPAVDVPQGSRVKKSIIFLLAEWQDGNPKHCQRKVIESGLVLVLVWSVVCLNAHVQICVTLTSQSFLNHMLTKERESQSDRTCSLQVAFVPEKDTLPQTLWLCSTGRSSLGREFTLNSHCQVKCLL